MYDAQHILLIILTAVLTVGLPIIIAKLQPLLAAHLSAKQKSALAFAGKVAVAAYEQLKLTGQVPNGAAAKAMATKDLAGEFTWASDAQIHQVIEAAVNDLKLAQTAAQQIVTPAATLTKATLAVRS